LAACVDQVPLRVAALGDSMLISGTIRAGAALIDQIPTGMFFYGSSFFYGSVLLDSREIFRAFCGIALKFGYDRDFQAGQLNKFLLWITETCGIW
jgi:hypothetical protein